MIGQVTRETIKQLNWAQEKRETAQLKPKIFLNSSEAKKWPCSLFKRTIFI
jgi:hypothetical protein